MDKIESQVMPAPPKMIASLRAGFDAVANHIIIIIIPISLDILIWLGPHLQIKTLINAYLDRMVHLSEINKVQAGAVITTGIGMMRDIASQFNLLSLLRTVPVGIPSLMASRLPTSTPYNSLMFIDLTNPILVISMAVCILVVGLVIGCLYYIFVAQLSISGKIEPGKAIKDWIWSSLQISSLAAAFLFIFILISIPSSCVISAIALFGIPLGQFAFFIYFGILLWLAFPLIFSPHGIFINHINALVSVQRSMLLTRMTLPTTTLFFFSIVAISAGLDVLWRVPAETSWVTLVGLAGHAFITSALLAASFIYYHDADRYARETLRMIKTQNENVV